MIFKDNLANYQNAKKQSSQAEEKGFEPYNSFERLLTIRTKNECSIERFDFYIIHDRPRIF
jgi:hypothetical protein